MKTLSSVAARALRDRCLALAQSGFFRDLSRPSIEALAAVSETGAWDRRAVLFREGQKGAAFFLLLEGAVQLEKATPDGGVVVIRLAAPGEIFAEVILFEQDRYPVTATAMTPVKALVFPRAEIHHLLEQPDFRRDFIAMLMRKQRYLTERMAFFLGHDVEERLFFFLREQCGTAPVARLPLNKKAVAAAIGASPETLSRLLRRLRRSGALRWDGRTIRRRRV